MSYGFVIDLPAPVEFYDASHVEFAKRPAPGMILHVARPTETGVQIIEVWRTKEDYERWAAENVGPVLDALAAAGWTPPEPVVTGFEPRGLVVPPAEIFA